MTLAGSALGLIRKFSNRGRVTPQAANQTDLLRAVPYSSNDGSAGVSTDFNSHLTDDMQVNTGLMEKYADYEDMGIYPELGAALSIYADEATQQDVTHGKSIWFESKDETIESILDFTFHKQLKIENSLWEMTRSLAHMGNLFEELVVFEGVGVVKLLNLPAPQARRIEDRQGNHFGFLQDMTMNFRTDTQSFLDRLNTRDPYNPEPDALRVFEPWEISHFRLRGAGRNELYGESILEPARWAWKRLQLMEDAMVLYKLCLRGDSQIWTPEGRKSIRDLVEGEEVYSFGHNKALKKTKVTYKKHNGQDKIFRVKSAHRELFANATHPVLVHTIEGQGSGKPREEALTYVEVQNLVPGKHRLVTPSRPVEDCEKIPLIRPEEKQKARVKPEAIANGFSRSVSWTVVQSCGVSQPYAERFYAGESWLASGSAVELVLSQGADPEAILEFRPDWGGVKSVNLPEFVTESFAQWFGFMLGDGYLAKVEIEGGHAHRVGLCLGADLQTNLTYKALFESFFGETKVSGDTGYRLGSYQMNSKTLYDFMILNGFIPGAHFKRVPQWVYRADPSIRLAFLKGLLDADGHWSEARESSPIRGRKRAQYGRLEMCNKALLEDVRELCMQLGLFVGQVRERFRSGGRTIKHTNVVLKDRFSYDLHISFKEQKESEPILSVESVGMDDIWDIGVEADEHNFVANGVVVHNTRSPQRYVFYVDVGDVPPNEARKIINQVKQDFKKQKVIDPSTGKMTFRYNPLCLDMNTQVPLLNGTVRNIHQLTEDFENGVENYVYSMDPTTKRVKPGKVVWAGVTKKEAQVVKVTLDNCKEIICTPDHRFMARDGSYIQAQHLEPGTSLMPLYRGINQQGYEYAVHQDHRERGPDKWKSLATTHKIVAEHYYGSLDGFQVHHIDENKRNNYPGNLQRVTPEEHNRLHRSQRSERIKKWNATEDHSIQVSKNNRKHNKGINIVAYNNSAQHTADNAIRSKSQKHLFATRRDEMCKAMSVKYPEGLLSHLRQLLQTQPKTSARAAAEVINGSELKNEFDALNANRKIVPFQKHHVFKAIRDAGFSDWNDFKFKALNNHKVSSVEFLEATMDVGCITVEGLHNFGLEFGVFVHNSVDEDMFIAKRKDKRSTEIDILSGLDGQQVDDAEYFRNKLFAALAIPKSYLGADETIARANLGQMDVRFAKTVMRLQREMKNGIRHIANVDLASRNIDPDKVDFDIKMVVPSGALEIAHIEVMSAKANLAQQMQGLNVPEYYLWSKILGFSDDEIETYQEYRAREQGTSTFMAPGGDPADSKSSSKDTPEEIRSSIERGISRQQAQITRALSDQTNRILDEVHANKTQTGRSLNELRGLAADIRRALPRKK